MTVESSEAELERYLRVARVLHDETVDHPWRSEVDGGPIGRFEVVHCTCDFAPYLDAAAIALGHAARLVTSIGAQP